MRQRAKPTILVIVIAIAVIAGLVWIALRSGQPAATEEELTAEAIMLSPSGETLGTATLHQSPEHLLFAIDVQGLTPGGHAVIVHAVGACTPDFSAAGGHFSPGESGRGFVHPNWKRGADYGLHSGDLPNIYAHADGSARADFFTDGLTLQDGEPHSLFDEDGSSVIIHAGPQHHGERETADSPVACGVIRPG